MMDQIIIKGAKFSCNIGVTQKERAKRQEIFIDAELFLDLKKAANTDRIEDTISYSQVHSLMKKTAEGRQYNLIEAMAGHVAEEILNNFSAESALVRVKKPKALADRNAKYAAVEIIRNKNF